MSVHLLLMSIVLGLSIAAPVGPIGILCIRRSIVDGQAAGFICGLGAATADALYGALGGFALSGISTWLVRGHVWMTLIGSAFLLYLGAKTFGAAAPDPAAAGGNRGGGALAAYLSTLLLTLANPLTILSFAAAFAAMGAATGPGAAAGYSATVTMLVGVFSGSALWWLVLTTVAGTARRRLSPPLFAAINRVSGVVLAGFGLYTLVGLYH
jgi:threonine/homoserine/homoserine lactone efflux protein